MKTICIAGKNDIAVDVLRYCMDHYPGFRILCITNRTETGVNSWQRSFQFFAQQHSIPICTLEDVYDTEDLIFLSAEFDRLIRPDKFRSQELYNIHFSLLPRYKGCYTSVHPLLHGDTTTGVTFHRIRRGIDTGEIIDQQAFAIDPQDTSLDVYKQYIRIGTAVILRNLDNVISGKVSARPQPQENSTYFSLKSIDYAHLALDTACTAFQIRNQIRAFCFRPYQILQWQGEPYVHCEITDHVSEQNPGTILEDSDLYTVISTIDYDVRLYKDVFAELLTAIRDGMIPEAKRLCTCREILLSQDQDGWSPLITAVCCNCREMVEFLIERGADLTVTDYNGTTLLMYAANTGLRTGDWTLFGLLADMGLDTAQADYTEKRLADDPALTAATVPEEIRKRIGNL